MAAAGGGYLAANTVTGNNFDSTDFVLASGVGAASGYLGPTFATTRLGAVGLGALANTAQYGLSKIAHNDPITAEGALFAASTGGLGGLIAGQYPKLDKLTLGNYAGATLTFDEVKFPEMIGDALWEQFKGGFTRAFLGGAVSNLPQEPEQCFAGDGC
jgi:hypothetical protein